MSAAQVLELDDPGVSRGPHAGRRHPRTRGQAGAHIRAIRGPARTLDPAARRKARRRAGRSATSLFDNGEPVIVLDANDLAVTATNFSSGTRYRPLTTGVSKVEEVVRRILVADDSLTVRELERKLLAGRGYHVETAIDGADAWNALRVGAYDLLVTDIDMPSARRSRTRAPRARRCPAARPAGDRRFAARTARRTAREASKRARISIFRNRAIRTNRCSTPFSSSSVSLLRHEDRHRQRLSACRGESPKNPRANAGPRGHVDSLGWRGSCCEVFGAASGSSADGSHQRLVSTEWGRPAGSCGTRRARSSSSRRPCREMSRSFSRRWARARSMS